VLGKTAPTPTFNLLAFVLGRTLAHECLYLESKLSIGHHLT